MILFDTITFSLVDLYFVYLKLILPHPLDENPRFLMNPLETWTKNDWTQEEQFLIILTSSHPNKFVAN
jgi:hypothetical protein